MQPYHDYVDDFNEALQAVKNIAPTVDSVNDLPSEIEELRFVRAFRQVMRVQNTLSCFADFSFEDLGISEQEYLDYRSKYLDLYEKANSSDKDKASALEDVDFEIELMHRDVINVAYILNLLSMLVDAKGKNYESKKEANFRYALNDIHYEK